MMKVDTKSNYRDTRTCFLCNKVGHIARDCRVVKQPSLAPQSIVKVMHANVKSGDCIALAHERAGDEQRGTIDSKSRWAQTRTLSTDTPVANMPVVEERICGLTWSVVVLSEACCSGGEAYGLTWSVRVLSDACCSGGEACELTWSVRVLSDACCSRGEACWLTWSVGVLSDACCSGGEACGIT